MKKIVVISTDNTPNYIKYLPYVVKAWNSLGWNTLTFYLGEKKCKPIDDEKNKVIEISPIYPYRDSTVIQVSRLTGHFYGFEELNDDDIMMTSDIDMMPLSNYWNPSNDKFTCYGLDLTNYSQYPICYIAAPRKEWNKLITESLQELLDNYRDIALSDGFWYTDQHISTNKLNNYENKTIINRGHRAGIAVGRLDRACWEHTKNIDEQKIDAHLLRPFNQQEAEYLLKTYHNTGI